jgi:Histidine kinase-, DNA gyrase B-, and HSP90-like ATPase
MAQHEIELVATTGVFRGLAKQNMLFHQCISELIDNSIAQKKEGVAFEVEVIFEDKGSGKYGVYICDNGKGMDLGKLKDALQLGKEPDPHSDRLHEHGFGLKNSLATLTRGIGHWKIWSKSKNSPTSSVQGPFGPKMTIEDDDKFPEHDFLPTDISTIVYAETSIDYIRTVQGRGGPTNDIFKLRKWLIEHLGVFYRGYLTQDPKTYEIDGVIRVSIDKNRLRVNPVLVPYANSKIEYIQVELNGIEYNLEYEYGTLDEIKRDRLVHDEKSQYYYLKNIPTQGIDVQLGKRVLATAMLDSIWKTQDGRSQLNRHNDYNDFVGEIRIPNVPRGILTTVNNKTDFNLDDKGWVKIFDALNEIKPPKTIREKTEKGLQNKWIDMLKATNPEETITGEKNVWGAGVRIDAYRKKENGDVIIYELKVGSAQPIHLYQLLMYWDGMEINGETPREAILLVEEYTSKIEEMVSQINSELKTKNGNSYNIKIEKHKDKGL